MHTVRTQLDYFQRVMPQVWDHYTVYALDLPGMGWSDIVPGASFEEPELRGAVVSETGEALAHAAIVAREYGIPAVVGARGATVRIKDGDLVTVDGTTGTVRFEV